MKIIKQRDIKDCGACSLASVILYYKGFVPLERVKLDTLTNKNGTTALNIIEASKKYGFDAVGVLVDSLDDTNIKLPAIAHLEINNTIKHFVVVYKITKDKVIIMDPAVGKKIMERSEFESVFSKVLLMFYPSKSIIKVPKGNYLIRLIFSLIKFEKSLIFKMVLSSIFLSIVSIVFSSYLKIGLDSLEYNHFTSTITIAYVFAFIILLKALLGFTKNKLEILLAKKTDLFLTQEYISHLFNLPLVAFNSKNESDIFSRIKDLGSFKDLLIEIFSIVFLDVFFFLIALPILIIISKEMFLIIAGYILIYLAFGITFGKIIFKKIYNNLGIDDELYSYLLEALKANNSIKNINATNYVLKKIKHKHDISVECATNLKHILNKIYVFKTLINELFILLINTMGIILIYNNKITISSLIAFNGIMQLFLNPIHNLVEIVPKLYYFKALTLKINDVLSIEKESKGTSILLDDNSISVRDLSFSYNNHYKIIKNKNFEIPAHSKVFLKGLSGVGKSSFCSILLKINNNYHGNIYIGDINLNNISLATIRNNITYVSQKENIFKDTILNNLLMGKDISEKKLLSICKICLIDELILSKNLKYDSVIDDDSLSGGEIQRLVLARALLKESSIIVLDEALSEVDYIGEKKIINNIINYFPNHTLIYISHKNHEELFDKIISFEKVI